MGTKKDARRAAGATLAICTDEEIVVAPAFGGGKGDGGAPTEESLREALRDVGDEDDFFFARMDQATAAGDADGTDVAAETRTSAPAAAPFGYFDMTTDAPPLPTAGIVAAKNVSSRDAVLVAENAEGETVIRKWTKGATILLENGTTRERRPVPPEGKALLYAPCLVYVKVGYERDDGATEAAPSFEVDVATVEIPEIKEEDFPVAFVTEEGGANGGRREIRAWGGSFWSASPPWLGALKRTSVDELERKRRLDAVSRWRKTAEATEDAAAALAKKARLAGKTLATLDDERAKAREKAARALIGGSRIVSCEGMAWHEIGEPRYVAYKTTTGKTHVTLSASLWGSRDRGDNETFPATMSKDEVLAYVEAKHGPVTADWSRGRDIMSVEVVDPKFVTIPKPAPPAGARAEAEGREPGTDWKEPRGA